MNDTRSLFPFLRQDQLDIVEAVRISSHDGREWATSEEVADAWRERFGVPGSNVGTQSIGSSLGHALADGAPINQAKVNGQPTRWRVCDVH